MEDKVRQLETLCDFVVRRLQDQHGLPAAPDVTQVVGAAALIFSAGDTHSRRVALGSAVELVVRAATGANLTRLKAAGRLLVVVLEKAQAPNTFFQRQVTLALNQNTKDIEEINKDMKDINKDTKETNKDVKEIKLLFQRTLMH